MKYDKTMNNLKNQAKCYSFQTLATRTEAWYNRNIKLLHIFRAAGEEREISL